MLGLQNVLVSYRFTYIHCQIQWTLVIINSVDPVKLLYYIDMFGTVEPLYNEVLGTMKITLLYQVCHYIRVKKQKYKELGPAKLPHKRILLYPTSL